MTYIRVELIRSWPSTWISRVPFVCNFRRFFSSFIHRIYPSGTHHYASTRLYLLDTCKWVSYRCLSRFETRRTHYQREECLANKISWVIDFQLCFGWFDSLLYLSIFGWFLKEQISFPFFSFSSSQLTFSLHFGISFLSFLEEENRLDSIRLDYLLANIKLDFQL